MDSMVEQRREYARRAKQRHKEQGFEIFALRIHIEELMEVFAAAEEAGLTMQQYVHLKLTGKEQRPLISKRKLNKEKAREIRRRKKAGESREALAKEFDVTPQMISLIERNKTYIEEDGNEQGADD